MKILNLYAGIGGNRKLWGNQHEITAVEYNEEIAGIYKDFFPLDNVVIADAHQYLLDHYKEFDFIWSSPPCQTHSKVRFMASKSGSYAPEMPDFHLYEEITFLRHFSKKYWCVENVKPYYEPLIRPDYLLYKHLFWNNFNIKPVVLNMGKHDDVYHNNQTFYNTSIRKYKIKHRKDQILRNMVNPELGLHILNQALGIEKKENLQNTLFEEVA